MEVIKQFRVETVQTFTKTKDVVQTQLKGNVQPMWNRQKMTRKITKMHTKVIKEKVKILKTDSTSVSEAKLDKSLDTQPCDNTSSKWKKRNVWSHQWMEYKPNTGWKGGELVIVVNQYMCFWEINL